MLHASQLVGHAARLLYSLLSTEGKGICLSSLQYDIVQPNTCYYHYKYCLRHIFQGEPVSAGSPRSFSMFQTRASGIIGMGFLQADVLLAIQPSVRKH